MNKAFVNIKIFYECKLNFQQTIVKTFERTCVRQCVCGVASKEERERERERMEILSRLERKS